MAFRNLRTSSDLEEAQRVTDASSRRSERDLRRADATLAEAQHLRAQLKAHTVANHFDVWLESLLYERREAQ